MYLQSLEYRQLAIIPSPATVPVLVDADIIVLNRCIWITGSIDSLQLRPVLQPFQCFQMLQYLQKTMYQYMQLWFTIVLYVSESDTFIILLLLCHFLQLLQWLLDVDIIGLNRCICNHWKYRQLAIIPSLATVPVLLDADIIGLNRCICNHWNIDSLQLFPVLRLLQCF